MHPPQGTVIFADNKLFSFLRYRSCQNNISTFPRRFAAARILSHCTTSRSLDPALSAAMRVFHFYYYLLLLLSPWQLFVFSRSFSPFSPSCAVCASERTLTHTHTDIFSLLAAFFFFFFCSLAIFLSHAAPILAFHVLYVLWLQFYEQFPPEHRYQHHWI